MVKRFYRVRVKLCNTAVVMLFVLVGFALLLIVFIWFVFRRCFMVFPYVCWIPVFADVLMSALLYLFLKFVFWIVSMLV